MVGFVLLDIAVILVAARAFGALALRVGQPRVVGEIVAGVALGPSLLGATIFTWDNAPGFLHCDASRSFLPVGADPATFVVPAASITQCLFPLQARRVLSILGQIAHRTMTAPQVTVAAADGRSPPTVTPPHDGGTAGHSWRSRRPIPTNCDTTARWRHHRSQLAQPTADPHQP